MSITCPETTDLAASISSISRNVSTVLDIGSGLYPQTIVDATLTICCEPDKGHAAGLIERRDNGENIAVLNLDWCTAVEVLPAKSVDTVTLINVLPHIEKQEAQALLQKTERVVRQQIIVVQLPEPGSSYGGDAEEKLEDAAGNWSQKRSSWTARDFDKSWLLIEGNAPLFNHYKADLGGLFCTIKDLTSDSGIGQGDSKSNGSTENRLTLDYILGLIGAAEPTLPLTDLSEIQHVLESIANNKGRGHSSDSLIEKLLEQNHRRSRYIIEARRGIADLRRLLREKSAEYEIAQEAVAHLEAKIERSKADNQRIGALLLQRDNLITDLTYQYFSITRSIRQKDAQLNELNQHLQSIKTGLTWKVASLIGRIMRPLRRG
jgi:hypothetical protein